jgi:CHAT domain-containing protein
VLETHVADLMNLLPDDTAVVTFVRVRVRQHRGKIASHFEAFVCRPTSEPAGYSLAWVDLGPQATIVDATYEWHQKITNPFVAARDAKRAAAKSFRTLVWDKVEPHLGPCSNVIIMPDYVLCTVPWSALPGRRPGTYLIEDYAISTVSHGQLLHALLTEPDMPPGDLLVVGGVAYDKPPKQSKPSGVPRTRAPAMPRQKTWDTLDATSDEAGNVAGLFPQADSVRNLVGRVASEAAVAELMPKCRYVHLATHGFFADPEFQSVFFMPKSPYRLETLFPISLVQAEPIHTAPLVDLAIRNPLVLSGVVLAGANLPAETDADGLPTGSDGILTAEEIVSLDLRNTELVVLSACETGLGRVAGGEGVFGLQRAFHLAGARTVIAGLWDLDDKATTALIDEFYRNLWQQKMGKLEALRAAQLAMLHRYDLGTDRLRADATAQNTRGPGPTVKVDPKKFASAPDVREPARSPLPPYFWAGFVLSGDWR